MKTVVVMLQEKIALAIKRQMVADVPIGSMLSGGVDSTTVSNIMTNDLDLRLGQLASEVSPQTDKVKTPH